MNQTATDLTNALRLINRPETWGKYRYRGWDKDSRTHRYCSVGALLHVIAIEDKRVGKVVEMLAGHNAAVPSSYRLDEACEAILNVIREDDYRLLERPLHCAVSNWNDDPLVWHQDVIFVFNEAIKIADALGA